MNEKINALVTIGYHHGELPWGGIVRNKYLSGNLMKNRNITFYEVKNSNVKSGDVCFTASSEIEKIIKKRDSKLWVNIHCGFHKEKSELSILYFGCDENIIKKARKINDIEVLPWGFMNKDERKAFDFGIPYVLVDSFFCSKFQNKDTFEDMIRGASIDDYKKLLKKTLNSINIIYDLYSEPAN